MKVIFAICLSSTIIFAQKKPIKTLDCSGKDVNQLLFLPGSKEIIFSQGKDIKLWDGSSKGYSFIGSGKDFIVSPDGKYLLISTGNELKISKIDRSQPVVPSSSTNVDAMAFSPDGLFIVTGGKDKLIKVWDVSTGSAILSISGHQSRITKVLISSDGNFIASASKDGIVKICRTKTGENLMTINAEAEPTALAFTPNNQYLLCSSGFNVKKWDINTRQAINSVATFPLKAISNDGNLGISYLFSKLYVFNLNNGNIVDSLNSPKFYPKCVTFNSDDNIVAAGGYDEISGYGYGRVKLWDIKILATSIRKTVPFEKKPTVLTPITPFVNTPPRNFTRYALVIGNSNYKKSGSSLNGNPINDAQDITQRLESLDFKVEPLIDATKSEIIAKLDAISKIAKNSETFLFFFAGHGIEDDGVNYLIPTDASLNRKDDLEKQTVALETVITTIKNMKCKTSLLFLDACRNNPFRSWARGEHTGLAPVDIDFNDLMTYYATQPNSVANNGNGRNGIFTEAILKHLKKGVEINVLMRKAAEDVIIKTEKTQSPWSGGNLMNKFVF